MPISSYKPRLTAMLAITMAICLAWGGNVVAQVTQGNVVPKAATQPAPTQTDVPKTLTPGSEPLKTLEGDAYPATQENIIKVALKYHALDLDDDRVIDDIAKVEYCRIYNSHHLDEFTWRKVRATLRAKINSESDRYPTLIYLNRREIFGQYNFNDAMLLLKPSSILQGVNMLELLRPTGREACGKPLDMITQNFITSLDKPLNIDGVKLNEDEAKAVISGLIKTANIESSSSMGTGGTAVVVNDSNPDNDVTRVGYGRYIVNLTGLSEPPIGVKSTFVFSGHTESVTFYEDSYYQKPFWRGLVSMREYAATQSSFDHIEDHSIKDAPGTSPSSQPTPPVQAK